MKNTIQKTGLAGLALCCGLLIAPLAQANDDTPLSRYLDCLNNQTKGSNGENVDRVANADRVLQACASQRQAVIDSMPREAALKQLRQIEYHLKGRESNEAETTETKADG